MAVIDITELELHRAALTGHCYRMLGSAFDAEDAVQEAMVRAWKGLNRFDGRASLKTWLYRIATNVCLDALSSQARRARPIEEGPMGTVDDELETRPRTHWLEPLPDARFLPCVRARVWHSSRRCSICRRVSGLRCCSARCSAGRRRKWLSRLKCRWRP